jgi:hypothetical protein
MLYNVSSCYKYNTQGAVPLVAVYTIDKIWKCLSMGAIL